MYRDEQIVGVGLNWDGADELKMLDSFELGRHDLFSHFVDIKQQAEVLGYQYAGLSNLAQRLLRFEPPKSKAVSSSTWLTMNAPDTLCCISLMVLNRWLSRCLLAWSHCPSCACLETIDDDHIIRILHVDLPCLT